MSEAWDPGHSVRCAPRREGPQQQKGPRVRGVNGSQSHDAQGRPDSEGHAVFDLATATTPGAEAGEQPPGQGAGKEGTAGGPGGLL